MIISAGRQLVFVLADDLVRIEIGQYAFEQSPVPIVGDPASVVALSRQVGHRFERRLVVGVDEYLQLSHADAEIRIVESVGDVPSQRSELSSFLDECVEEAETEDQALEYLQKKSP